MEIRTPRLRKSRVHTAQEYSRTESDPLLKERRERRLIVAALQRPSSYSWTIC